MPISEVILKKYMSDYFVETGLGLGEGTRRAVDAGFRHITTIEILEKTIEIYGQPLMDEFDNIDIICGDSGKLLADVIRNIDSRITFWLDGHHSNSSPLLKELDAIHKYVRHIPIILIDDVPQWQRGYKIKIEKVRKKLLAICPHYDIFYETGINRKGGPKPDHIMVAQWKLQ